jgi:WD40 repeat protein
VLSHCADGTTYLWEIPETKTASEPGKEMPIPSKLSVLGQNIELTAVGNVLRGIAKGHHIEKVLSDKIETIAASPNGEWIAAGTKDDSFKHHHVELFKSDGTVKDIRLAHSDGVVYTGFSHSGQMIVTCSEDFSARVWDLSGKPLTPPLRHRDQVRWAAFNQSDEWIATASWDRSVRLWEIRTGVPLTPPLKISHTWEWVEFGTDSDLLLNNKIRTYITRLPALTPDLKRLLDTLPTPPELLDATE